MLRQYEYSYKGQKDNLLMQFKSSSTKRLEMEFKYKTDIKNSHYEINRANKTMKTLLARVKELQGDV